MLVTCLSYACHVLAVCFLFHVHSIRQWPDIPKSQENEQGSYRKPNVNHYACHMLAICLSYACHMLVTCLQYASYSMCTQSGTAPTDRKAKKMNRAPNERLTWTIVLVICLSYACHMLVICLSYACHMLVVCLWHTCSMLPIPWALNQKLPWQTKKPRNWSGRLTNA